MEKLAGNPTLLQGKVDEYSLAAIALADAVAELEAIAVDGAALSVEQLDEVITSTKSRLGQARTRYETTTGALSTYTVALDKAHDRADAAISASATALSRRETAESNAAAYRESARYLESEGFSESYIQEKLDLAAYQDSLASAALTEYQGALAEHTAAQTDLNNAAQTAIAGIEIAFDDTSDTIGDHIGAFGDWIAEAWAGFTAWVDSVLSDLIDGIRSVISAVLDVLSYVFLVIAAITIIVVMLSLVFSIAGPFLIADILGQGDISGSIAALKAILLAFPTVQLYLQSRILTDVIAPDPDVDRFGPKDGDGSSDGQIDAVSLLNGNAPDSFDDIVSSMGQVDDAGGVEGQDETSVINIRSVVGPDGVERFIVTLPSTQDWGLPGDAGATNDLDGNLALFLGDPALRTQYERAIDAALADAGIDKNDPIVFAGFSQGGIMAGHYAAYRGDDYNIQGIITAGSPIDAMPIPDNVAVVQVQHKSDPVHQLDGVYQTPDTSNHIRVTGGNDLDIATAHNAAEYAGTAAGTDKLDTANSLFDDFLIDSDRADEYRTSSVQYSWSE